jgi:RHS repeat-associated protein
MSRFPAIPLVLIIFLLLTPWNSLRAAPKTTFYIAPAVRQWAQAGTHFYKMMADTTSGAGTIIENGQIRFKVGSSSGAAFASNATIEICEGSTVGTVVASGLAQSAGATETGWLIFTLPADFTSGSRFYYARKSGSSTVHTDFGIKVTANAPPQIGAITPSQAPDGTLPLSFVATDAESDQLTWKASLYRDGTTAPLITRTGPGNLYPGTLTVPNITVPEQQSSGMTNGLYFWLVQLFDSYHINDPVGDAKVSPKFIFTATSAPLPNPVVSVNYDSFSELTPTSAVLRWTWSGNTANANDIRISVRRISDDALIVNDVPVAVTATNYTVAGLAAATQYRINVRYTPKTNFTEGSTAFEWWTRFDTQTPNSPTDGASMSLPASLAWNGIPPNPGWPGVYRIQIASSPAGFSPDNGLPSPVLNTTSTQPSYQWSGGVVNQTYYWTVHAASGATSGPSTSAYSAPRAFTITGNTPSFVVNPAVSIQANRDVRVTYTVGNPTASSSLTSDLYLWNPTTSAWIFASKKSVAIGGAGGFPRVITATYTRAELLSFLAAGTSTKIKVHLINNNADVSVVETDTFTISSSTDPLGIASADLHNKKLGGAFVLEGQCSGPVGDPWRSFVLKKGTQIIAFCDSSQSYDVSMAMLRWRRYDTAAPISLWSDLGDYIAGATALTVMGTTEAGVQRSSDSFTVSLQTTLNASITPPAIPFPRYDDDPTVTVSSIIAGATGATTLHWNLNGGASTTAPTFTTTITKPGWNVINLRVDDTAQNITYAQFEAPLAWRSPLGNADANGSGSSLFHGVDVGSGNLHLSTSDMAIPAIGVPFVIGRSYNSNGQSGFRWHFNFESYLETRQDFTFVSADPYYINITKPDGSQAQFFLGLDGKYHSFTPGNHDLLVENYGTSFTLFTASTPPVAWTYEIVGTGSPINKTFRLKSIKDLRGHGLTLTYRTGTSSAVLPGLLEQIDFITDQSGRTYTFNYGADNRISSVVANNASLTTSYTWDADGNLFTVRDVRSNESGTDYRTTYAYHTSGNGLKRLNTITLPEGNQAVTGITYQADGKVQQINFPYSGFASFSYGQAAPNNATYTTVTRPSVGNNVRFVLDRNGNITEVTDSFGVGNRITTLSRIAEGDVLNTTARTADLGLTKNVTASSGIATDLVFSGDGRALPMSVKLSSRPATTFAYDTTNLATNNFAPPTSITDSRAQTSTTEYTSTGELRRLLNPLSQGGSVSAFDEATGLPQVVDDGRGNTTSFTYTAHGDLETITVPDNDNPNQRVIRFTYPAGNLYRGLPSRITDRKGYKTDLTWDAAGNQLSARALDLVAGNGERQDTVQTFDRNGRRTSATDRRNKTTIFGYDDLDRLVSVTPPGVAAANAATRSFDALGRLVDTKNENGTLIRRVYGSDATDNAGGMLWKITAPNAPGGVLTLETRSYQIGTGLLDHSTDGVGLTRTLRYDSLKRPDRITDGEGNYVEVEYESTSDLIVRRSVGRDGYSGPPLPTTLYEYDAASRLARVCNVLLGNRTFADPNNLITTMTYDALGNVDIITDPRGKIIDHDYDALGHLSRLADHDGRAWLYRYDANGNLREEVFPGDASNPVRTITRSFGLFDRLDSLNYGDGLNTASYQYDANGNRTRLTDRWGSTAYEYDERNRLKTLVGSTPSHSLSYTWKDGGQLASLTYPGSRSVSYSYDSLDRLTTITPWAGGAITCAWRANGQPDLLTNGNGTSTDYQYHPTSGRLSRLLIRTSGGSVIADENMEYDPAANITRIFGDLPKPGSLTEPPRDAAATMTVDNANRLSTLNGQSVTNDPAGRTRALPAPLSGTATWEGLDWLTSWTSGGSTTAYTYDGDGVRRSRTLPSASETRYLVDPVGALPNVVAETNTSGTPQRYYIHAPGLGLLASVDTSSNATAYHFDHRGNTLALSNAGQSVSETYAYSPYGATTPSNTSSSNPFRFVGQFGVMDELASGTTSNSLHFMRARYYSATSGKFVSKDSLAGSASEPQTLNQFAYGTGNPLKRIDPTGHSPTNGAEAFFEVVGVLDETLHEFDGLPGAKYVNVASYGYDAVKQWHDTKDVTDVAVNLAYKGVASALCGAASNSVGALCAGTVTASTEGIGVVLAPAAYMACAAPISLLCSRVSDKLGDTLIPLMQSGVNDLQDSFNDSRPRPELIGGEVTVNKSVRSKKSGQSCEVGLKRRSNPQSSIQYNISDDVLLKSTGIRFSSDYLR